MKYIKHIITMIVILNSSSLLASSDDEWGFCNESNKLAYSDTEYRNRKPVSDWLCALITGRNANESVQGNTQRCLNAQDRECKIGFGGSGSRGDQNVPSGAWYWAYGSGAEFKDIRCQCGCFTGDMKVLTSLGYKKFEDLSKNADQWEVSAKIFDPFTYRVKDGKDIQNIDLVVGSELDEILLITTETSYIELTSLHPVMIYRGNRKMLVQAKNISMEDFLVKMDGSREQILSIESGLLEEDDNLVYNFDTKEDLPKDHVLIVNNLQMGDLYWQNKLSEKENRVQNMMDF